MKRIIPLAILVIAMIFTACTPSVEDVSKKIQENKELSQKDYTVLLDYVEQGLTELSDSVDAYQNDREHLLNSIMTMGDKYQENGIFMQKFAETDPSTLDEANRKKYDNIQKLYEDCYERVSKVMSVMSTINLHDDSDAHTSATKMVESDSLPAEEALEAVSATSELKK